MSISDYKDNVSDWEVFKRHINRLRMEDRAYRHVYGHTAIFHDLRLILSTLLQKILDRTSNDQCIDHEGKQIVDQSILIASLTSMNIIALNTAHSRINEAINKGLLSKVPKGGGPDGRKAYLYLNEEQRANAAELLGLIKRIDGVLVAQDQAPANKNAGSELLPPEVFFNIELHER